MLINGTDISENSALGLVEIASLEKNIGFFELMFHAGMRMSSVMMSLI